MRCLREQNIDYIGARHGRSAEINLKDDKGILERFGAMRMKGCARSPGPPHYALVKSVANRWVDDGVTLAAHQPARQASPAQVKCGGSALTNCNGCGARARVQSKAFEGTRITLTRRENDVKRLMLTLIAGSLLAAALGGCVLVPAPGYYYGGGGHYHHGYYDR
jgi:hypothetical protein